MRINLTDWRRPHFWLVLGLVFFIVYFSLAAWFRHANFHTSQYDLGNMDSVLWHTLHGKFWIMTDPTALVQVSRTAIHADFLLLGYLPFYLAWPDPRVMMIVQVLIVASGALPLYMLGRRWLSGCWGALFAWLYLFYPPLLWGLIFDVHAVMLAAPLLLWAVWAMVTRRYWWYAVFIALALLAKEEIGFIVGLLGLYFLITKRAKWVSLATVITGFGWSALMLGWAIPQARTENQHFALSYYSDFGGSLSTVFKSILTQPLNVLRHVFTPDHLAYLALLLWPVGFLSLVALPLLLVAAPSFGINLLSANDNLSSIYYHYAAPIAPIIMLSALAGLTWLFRHRIRSNRWQMWVGRGLFAAWLTAVYFWAPLPGTRHNENAVAVFRLSPYRQIVASVQKQISPTAKVTTTNNLAPHFTQRDWNWSFPQGVKEADVAVILLGGRVEPATQSELISAVELLRESPAWELIAAQDQFYAFRRVD